MNAVIVLAIVFAILFAVPYVTKRRLGVLALALAAGAMLSQLWVGNVTPIVASAGFVLVKPPLESVVGMAITLLPALILIPVTPAYSSMIHRVIGSLTFALLAITLLSAPLGSALIIEGTGKMVYDTLATNQAAIVSICLGLAILDLLITKLPKRRKD
jgi:hypothetical protein